MTALHDLIYQDAANRELAIDPSRSFIVQAPAGAGKTELLTQRFLALLNTVENPEEIIALTFTNKAAAEMRERVLSSLRTAASGIRPDLPHKQKTYELSRSVLKIDAEKQWGLLQHSGRLQICTLDALCGKLARQLPLLSRFGSQPKVSSDNTRYYQQAVSNTLDLLETDSETGQAIAHVLTYFDNDLNKLSNLLVSMLNSRDQWLSHAVNHNTQESVAAAEAVLSELVRAELADVVANFPGRLQETVMPAVRYVATQAFYAQTRNELPENLKPLIGLQDWATPLKGSVADMSGWRGVVELFLTAKGELRSKLPSGLGLSEKEGKPFAQSLKACLEELQAIDAAKSLSRIRKLPNPSYSGAEWQLIEYLIQILKVASAQLWLVFKAEKTVDFIQIAQNALEALGDDETPSELQQQLDYAIQHLLVDEFQDTSPTQVTLLERLTSGWESGDGRTLFLVGDPMQSIYRFRKADVSLFLKVREHGIGSIRLKPLQLFRNNRSHQAVVDWVNAAFPSVLAKEDNPRLGAVRFSEAAPTKPNVPSSGVYIHPVIAPDASDVIEEEEGAQNPIDEQEALKIVELIRQARQENPAGKIAILVRARTHLDALVAELRRHATDLPYQAVEIEGLATRQYIQDLVSLTRALYHRADRVHWLAILRAPWCGLRLIDLHQLAASDHRSTVWQLMNDADRVQKMTEDGQTRLAHLHQVLSEAFQGQGRQRPRRWIEGVWQALGGPNCLQQGSEWIDVQTYFDLLDRLTRHGQLDLSELDADLEKLFAVPNPKAGDQIQIMTIHKSKGLEFDTVILPGLHRVPRANERQLLIWDQVLCADGDEHLVVAAPSIWESAPGNEPSKYDFLIETEKTRAANEAQRLLYVAVTRAIRQLHLVGIAKRDPKQEEGLLKRPGSSTLLALLWNTVKNDFEMAAQAAQEEQPSKPKLAIDEQNFASRLERLHQVGYPQALRISDAQLDRNALNGDAIERANNLEADTGTLVHRYLEMIARDGPSAWPSRNMDRQVQAMATWFIRRGYSEMQSQAAAKDAKAILHNVLGSDVGRWILKAHEDAGCEVSFGTQNNGYQQSHIVDRTFVENGIRWVIDYKTTYADISDGEVLAGKVVEYQSQLERYRQLFLDKGHEVQCAVYFCRHDKLVPIPPPVMH